MTDSPPRRPSPAPAHDAGPDPAAAPPPRPSFEEVYTSLLPHVLRVLWRMGVPARNLRDVAQEVFLVVHRRFEECDPRLSIKAWVGSIASHLALRHQRLARNRRELLARSEAERVDVADPGGDAEALCARAEAQRIVRALVQRLEEDRRAVFILYELEGVDMRSIAGALQISENTAWDRLRRARKDLAAAVRRLCARDRDALGGYGARLALGPLALADGPLLLELGDARLDLPEDLGALLWARLQGLLASGEGEGSAAVGEAAQAFPSSDDALEEAAAVGASRAPARIARAGVEIARSKLVAAGAAVFLAGAGAGSGATHARGSRAAPPEVALAHGGALAAVAAVAGGPAGVGATAARVDATMPAASMAPAPALPGLTAPAPALPGLTAPAPASPAPAALAPASPASAAPAPASPAAPPPAPLASTPAAPAPPAMTAATAAVPPLDADLTLIQRAVAALGAGEAAEALDALDRHARSYPRSARAQQRETLAIQALDQSGRRAEAAARAARFRAAFPGSAYLPAIENALSGSP
ncbi:RNA polymerase sigma factor [Sorangium sp. So ce854]|uniref:RNA polymerase sigma factor n=1 Tax=Sorangium sp. So ce854 TaxID=3133322 RepID=UPI003F645094